MACPTLISPPSRPWTTQTILPNSVISLALPAAVPDGATVVFAQLSVRNAPVGTTAAAIYPTGEASNPVRVQALGIDSDTLGFLPVWSDRTIHIKNYDLSNNIGVYIGLLGYA